MLQTVMFFHMKMGRPLSSRLHIQRHRIERNKSFVCKLIPSKT